MRVFRAVDLASQHAVAYLDYELHTAMGHIFCTVIFGAWK